MQVKMSKQNLGGSVPSAPSSIISFLKINFNHFLQTGRKENRIQTKGNDRHG